MEMEEIVNLALNKKYDEAFSELEKLPPRAMNEFADRMNAKDEYALDNLYMHLSKEQNEKFHWLSSSRRVTKYILSIPEEEMTDQDWADLRAADF